MCDSYGSGDCGSSYVGGFLVGGGMGGFLGMLVGGQFPKKGWPL